tara:strand:- start:601 stop:1212 length:612 start_codon:yes stop_codon:yes gene_type:complete
MELEQNTEFEKEGLEALGHMNRPIPGQSLTSNPDEPYPWESPPEYTNMKEALDFVLDNLMDEEAYVPILNAIEDGIPISDVVQQILYIGFNEGKWNPDMLLMLVEPLMYVVMALCEKAGIEYTLYRGEEEDDDQEINQNIKNVEEETKSLQELTKSKIVKPTSTGVPKNILQELQELEIPQESLMSKPQQENNTPSGDSLLAR